MTINLTQSLLSAQIHKPEKQSLEAIVHQKASPSAAVNVSVESDQKPLTLAYQAAIDRINEAVAPYLGEDAIARGLNSDIDVSPEATAERIVNRSTALFSRFENQNPDRDVESNRTDFADIIRGGITKGFDEAREILTGLGVLEDGIESNVDLTFDLVMEGLSQWAAQQNAEPRSE